MELQGRAAAAADGSPGAGRARDTPRRGWRGTPRLPASPSRPCRSARRRRPVAPAGNGPRRADARRRHASGRGPGPPDIPSRPRPGRPLDEVTGRRRRLVVHAHILETQGSRSASPSRWPKVSGWSIGSADRACSSIVARREGNVGGETTEIYLHPDHTTWTKPFFGREFVMFPPNEKKTGSYLYHERARGSPRLTLPHPRSVGRSCRTPGRPRSPTSDAGVVPGRQATLVRSRPLRRRAKPSTRVTPSIVHQGSIGFKYAACSAWKTYPTAGGPGSEAAHPPEYINGRPASGHREPCQAVQSLHLIIK